jgi:hypothetical protein
MKLSVRGPERKRTLERTRLRWKDNTKMDKIREEGVDCIYLPWRPVLCGASYVFLTANEV